MIGFWVGAGALSALVLLILVWPVLRRAPSAASPAEQLDLAVFRDQLKEIDADLERGLIASEQAEALRLEIRRRIIAIAKPSTNTRAGADLPIVLGALAVPLVAIGLYWSSGSPHLPDQPYASRGRPSPGERAEAKAAATASLGDVIGKLEQHLASHPLDLDGWILLGRSYLTVDRPSDAVGALKRAVELSNRRLDVLGAYGEALIGADSGRVGAEAHAVFSEVLAGDAFSPHARFFLGLERAQRGDLSGALQDWIDLLALGSEDAPWRAAVVQYVERAAAELGVDPATVAPSAAVRSLAAAAQRGESRPAAGARGMAEGMPPAEREAMIRGMVARLAERLERSPEDAEGWERLARAYDVLGEKAKADEARERAEQARSHK